MQQVSIICVLIVNELILKLLLLYYQVAKILAKETLAVLFSEQYPDEDQTLFGLSYQQRRRRRRHRRQYQHLATALNLSVSFHGE